MRQFPIAGYVIADPMTNRHKVLRGERDWSQAELAERLDISRQAVNAIETGKHDPSLPLAFRIAALRDHEDVLRCPRGNEA